MAERPEVIKLRANQALSEVIEPGDQVIAGTMVIVGPASLRDRLGASAFAAFTAAVSTGWRAGARAAVFAGVGGALGGAVWGERRPVFLAVTERQLICCRVPDKRNKPAQPIFSTPLAGAAMTWGRFATPGRRSVRFSGLGPDGRDLRLSVSRRWLNDLNEVLAALLAGGASVEIMPPSSSAHVV